MTSLSEPLLNDEIRGLATLPVEGGVVSAYLDTSTEQVMGEGYLVRLVNAIRAYREQRPEEVGPSFDRTTRLLEASLAGGNPIQSPGLAIFAGADAGWVRQIRLPRVPSERLYWGSQIELGPLYEILDDFERVAVLLLDKERARYFSIFLGRIEDRSEIVDDVPGKQATGGWFALSQTRYARHHELHVLRHVSRAIGLLGEKLREHPFERLLLGGPPEAIEMLRRHLPRALRSRLAGSISIELFASDDDVLQNALRIASEAERRAEVKMVDELLESAGTTAVTLGIEPTLAALGEGRAHQVFMSEHFAGSGAVCSACPRLSQSSGTCPHCGAELRAVEDLRQAAAAAAMQTGARLEHLGGAAAVRLDGYGGLAAWTRY